MGQHDSQEVVVLCVRLQHAPEHVDVPVGEDLGVLVAEVDHGDAPGLGGHVRMDGLVGGKEPVADLADTSHAGVIANTTDESNYGKNYILDDYFEKHYSGMKLP